MPDPIPPTRDELKQQRRAHNFATARRWVYGVCIAAVPVAVYFEVLPAEAAPVILPLILAITNVKE